MTAQQSAHRRVTSLLVASALVNNSQQFGQAARSAVRYFSDRRTAATTRAQSASRRCECPPATQPSTTAAQAATMANSKAGTPGMETNEGCGERRVVQGCAILLATRHSLASQIVTKQRRVERPTTACAKWRDALSETKPAGANGTRWHRQDDNVLHLPNNKCWCRRVRAWRDTGWPCCCPTLAMPGVRYVLM
jgi:hypothetical protein